VFIVSFGCCLSNVDFWLFVAAVGCLFLVASFFLLAAAWVDPGRSALQSAEQWRKGRYGRMHQVVKYHF